MKKILLGLIGLSMTAALTAQNNSVLFISKKTGNVINGTTYTIYGDAATPDVKEEFYAVMSKQDSMAVAVKREEVSIINGTKDYFCWYLCYGSVDAGTLPVWYADDTLTMYMNDTISNFAAYLKPEMNLGTAEYRYVFYPGDNPTDSVYFNIVFDIVTVGIEEEKSVSINAYPNPASDVLNIEVPQTANAENLQARLYDITGKTRMASKLVRGLNVLDLQGDMPKGMYILQLVSGEEILSAERIILD